ncbi:hypothetical protein CLOM_g16636 [Closterium sp. NIES-68]|nr:hypothetical protein CLOM_g16636 [Closterium sp. NIES-68]GJP69036.1 hypothetical protein CLOP_g25664 [Closterium sp. NIES-67]
MVRRRRVSQRCRNKSGARRPRGASILPPPALILPRAAATAMNAGLLRERALNDACRGSSGSACQATNVPLPDWSDTSSHDEPPSQQAQMRVRAKATMMATSGRRLMARSSSASGDIPHTSIASLPGRIQPQ